MQNLKAILQFLEQDDVRKILKIDIPVRELWTPLKENTRDNVIFASQMPMGIRD